MSTYLYRLARWCFRHRWTTLVAWALIVAATVSVAMLSHGRTNDSFTIPGTEAQQVTDLLKHKLPAASGASTQVVFATEHDGRRIDAPASRRAIERSVHELAHVAQVTGTSDPFRTHTVSKDGRVALATVSYGAAAGQVRTSTLDDIEDATAAARHAGLDVEFNGAVYPKPDSGGSSTEAIGIMIALLISIVTFGSFLAAGLPILTAIVGLVTTLMGVTAIAAVVDVPSAATSVATMLGLSVGIDYALFILSRYRGYLGSGHDPEDAAGRASGTAGSSVVFAGLSVIIALCGLAVVGIPFLTIMGLAAAGTVLAGLLIALTLVPAACGFLGTRLGRSTRAPVARRGTRAAVLAERDPDSMAGTRWAKWVVRHRVPVVIIGLLTLGALALPTLKMDLGLPGAGSRPTSDTSRRAYDLAAHHFGPGFNGTLTVLAEDARGAEQARTVADRIAGLPDVASSTVNATAQGVAIINVVPRSGPNDAATADLVHLIRDDRADLVAGTGTHVLVGGQTASDIDVSAKLSSALPVFLFVVVGLAFVLLTFAFRTILVPIKSILGFLLSTGAAFGAQVAVFQWGWLKDLFGIEPSQTLSFLPIIVLAIVFGLSSDYEVFVASRIKERLARTGDARDSVVYGTGYAARVVTAAALIMGTIFLSFLFAPDPITKSIGFSFAVGVLVDAFVVRLTLVPAVMAIVGEKMWYHPRWFARFVPDPDIEGEKLERRLDAQPAR